MTTGLRVTLLGSGSPSPSLHRCHPAALVEWGDKSCVLVDAGDGVVAQLQRAGADFAAIEHVALTHMHWDHILGYPAFVWGSWIGGRRRLHTFGPTGTVEMHERLLESYYRDQALWAIDVGFHPDGWHATTVEDVAAGWSAEIDGCVVSAGDVVHPPMSAVAFRFDYEGKSIVISGDTAACPELVEFSRGADVLVVDACAVTPSPSLPPGADRTASRVSRLTG